MEIWLHMHIKNESIQENAKKVKLRIIASGWATLDTKWANIVKNSLCSRLYFVLDGEFYIISDKGEETLLKKGNAYLIPSGYTYRYGCKSTVEQIYFHFQLSAFDRIDLFRNCRQVLSFPISDMKKDYFKSLALSDGFTSVVMVQSEIYSALSTFIERYNLSFELPDYSSGVNEAIKYIEKNLSIQLSIKKISASAHLAPSTLSRNFRKETGMSVGEYIDSLIMFSAEQKLMAGELSVSEISELYGFCDQFYFSRKFKEKYGVSPREYRKNTPL